MNNLGLEFLNYFTHRRKQLQDWDPAPPHWAGWLIFILTSLELSMGFGLLKHESLTEAVLNHLWETLFVIFVFEWITTRMGHVLAKIFKKHGHQSGALTFLHLGLLPYLLFLPIALLVALHGQLHGLIMILFILLTLQVFANWKESLEIAYELTSFQSLMVLYLVGGIVFIFIGGLTYFSFLRILSSSL